MFQLVKNYVSKMTKEDVDKFARKHDIYLCEEEIDFLYRFVKKNYEALYVNPYIDLSKYKNHFTDENYEKIMRVVTEYRAKYLGR